MAKQLQVRYTIQSGSLPNGMTLNPDTGAITGSPGWDALGLGPTWTGPAVGSLGSYNEGDTITNVTFSATSNKGPVIFSLATDNSRLPWGLSFNPVTGVLSGTIAALKQRTKEMASTSDGPQWNTSFGKIAGYDEGSAASVQVSATPIGSRTIKFYQVVDGALPWGLVLNPQTGAITGTVGPLKNPGAYVDVPKLPVPVWVSSTDLTTVNEYDSVSLNLVATPASGRSMAKYVIRSGALPWGLKLNTQTGAITGTTVENRLPNDTPFFDDTKNPVFSDTVGGINQTVVEGGSIGSYAKGATVSATFSNQGNVPNVNKLTYYIARGKVPRGLTLNPLTGQLSGTIKNDLLTVSATYNFRIGIMLTRTDSLYQIFYAFRNYTITVQ